MVLAISYAPILVHSQIQSSSKVKTQSSTKQITSGKLLNEDEIGLTNYADMIDSENANNLKLPPLSVLFDNMKNTPRYKKALNDYKIAKSSYKTVKRTPLNWVGVGASYAYGQFGSQNQSSAESTPVTTSVSNGVSTSYGVSVSVGTTIGNIVDYSSTVKRARLETENSKLTFQQEFQMQKLEVMQLYNKIETLLNTLSSLAQSEILATADYEYSEQEFMAGSNNNPNAMSRAKERQNAAIIAFSNAKTQLNAYLIQLELLTQTQIFAK